MGKNIFWCLYYFIIDCDDFDYFKINFMIRKNFYIELLKYASNKKEFTDEDIKKELNLNLAEKKLYFGKLRHNKLLFENTGRNKKIEYGELSIFIISVEGRFKLLEYEALIDARKSSTVATILAIVAIIISSISVICSIIIK